MIRNWQEWSIQETTANWCLSVKKIQPLKENRLGVNQKVWTITDLKLKISSNSHLVSIFPLWKPYSSTLVFTTLPSLLSVTIPPCKYEPDPHQRSHLWRERCSQWGGKTLLDFTKEVNRWTQRGEERWEMDEQCFSALPLWVCNLSQDEWAPSCVYLIRWIVATEAEFPSAVKLTVCVCVCSLVWG